MMTAETIDRDRASACLGWMKDNGFPVEADAPYFIYVYPEAGSLGCGYPDTSGQAVEIFVPLDLGRLQDGIRHYLANNRPCPKCGEPQQDNGLMRWCESGHVYNEDEWRAAIAKAGQ